MWSDEQTLSFLSVMFPLFHPPYPPLLRLRCGWGFGRRRVWGRSLCLPQMCGFATQSHCSLGCSTAAGNCFYWPAVGPHPLDPTHRLGLVNNDHVFNGLIMSRSSWLPARGQSSGEKLNQGSCCQSSSSSSSSCSSSSSSHTQTLTSLKLPHTHTQWSR